MPKILSLPSWRTGPASAKSFSSAVGCGALASRRAAGGAFKSAAVLCINVLSASKATQLIEPGRGGQTYSTAFEFAQKGGHAGTEDTRPRQVEWRRSAPEGTTGVSKGGASCSLDIRLERCPSIDGGRQKVHMSGRRR